MNDAVFCHRMAVAGRARGCSTEVISFPLGADAPSVGLVPRPAHRLRVDCASRSCRPSRPLRCRVFRRHFRCRAKCWRSVYGSRRPLICARKAVEGIGWPGTLRKWNVQMDGLVAEHGAQHERGTGADVHVRPGYDGRRRSIPLRTPSGIGRRFVVGLSVSALESQSRQQGYTCTVRKMRSLHCKVRFRSANARPLFPSSGDAPEPSVWW